MKAVIFDLDGTLLDVREGFYYQFQALTQEFDGAPVSREAIAAAAYGRTEDIVRALVRNQTVPLAQICRRHTELRVEAYDKFLRLHDNVDELLPILHRLGYTVAAVTAGNKMTVDSLKKTGIHDHFHTVITGDQVASSKPDPEGIYLALRKMHIHPSQAIMVGDGVVDILAGKKAGLAKTVGVTHGFGSPEELMAAGADHIIDNIPALLDVLE
jgi:HAD superfamily hydrolase (TIGR01509 family)